MFSFAKFGNDLYTGKRSYDIVGSRKVILGISVVLMLISLLGITGRGLNFSIEFSGGSEVRVGGVTQLDDYEARAKEAVSGAVEGTAAVSVTKLGTDTLRIQTDTLGDGSEEATSEVRAALAEEFGVTSQDVTSSFVGPSWGETVTKKAIYSLVVFLILLTVVLSVYFQTWKMAAAAMVALLHDLAFTVGIYALAGFEVSPATMIGFLTILGYSIYDTVVVFDKVRENTVAARASGRLSFGQAANLAVNQTLVRSINTSVVALLPVGAILVVGFSLIGPGTLLDLALALFVGLAVGTYSSIFLATPLLVWLRRGEPETEELARRAQRYQERHADDAAVQDAPGTGRGEQEPVPAGNPLAPAAGLPTTGRDLHPYARTGPRNQPRRAPKKSRRR